MRSSPVRVLLIFLFALLVGCATSRDDTYVTEIYVSERWLPFIQNGKTTRNELVAILGKPTRSYQDGKILAFRLILVEAGRVQTEALMATWHMTRTAYFTKNYKQVNNRRQALSQTGRLLVLRPSEEEQRQLRILTREAEYSLVLVCDHNDIVVRHSLVRVKP